MTRKHTNMTDRARESVERAAYAAVGAPTTALKALGARLRDLSDTVRASRHEISGDLAREVDAWIAEGEQVIDRAMRRIRSSEVGNDVRAAVRSTREAARTRVDEAADAVARGVDVVDPDQSLTTINGVGPKYEDQLGNAGVVGISTFLARTTSEADRKDLAATSGVSADKIETWRAQVDLTRVDGVGDANELLLHRAGVWTVDQLATTDPPELARRMRSVTIPDAPGQMPTKSLIERWKQEARRISKAK